MIQYTRLKKDVKELLVNMPQTVIGAIFDFYELKNRDNITSEDYFYIVNKEIKCLDQIEDVEDFLVEFFKYAVQSIMYDMTDKNMMVLLNIIRRTSLIDQYIFFLSICDYILRTFNEGEMYLWIKAYIQELSFIDDDHLIAVRFLFDTKENRRSKYTLKNGLEKAKEEFIKGNLQYARLLTVELLKSSANNIEAINLLVDINILVGDEFKDFSETNLGDLIYELQSVYAFSSDKNNDMQRINKLVICTSFSTWSESISNSIMYRCQKYEDVKNYKIEMLINLQYLDIETVIAGLSAKESIEFINEKLNMNNQYIKFRKSCCEKQFVIADSLCKIEQIKDLIFVYNDENDICERVEHLGKMEGRDVGIAAKGIKYFISTIKLDENFEIISRISTILVVSNIYASLLIPLKKIIDYIDNSDRDIRKSIYSPILYYVYSSYYNKEKKDDLGIICEDFFFYNNIESPKQMLNYFSQYDKETLIFFLKNVCTPKIMDMSVVSFSSSQERDQERVEICNGLCQMDSDNAEEYEKEIRKLTKKLMIKKEHKTIEENKIQVNTEGIKENLVINYKSDFFRYKFYLDKRVRQWSDKQSGLYFADITKQILHSLVYHIRDAFVSSNEYGLDGYLSLNIRHGTLADELRSPIYKSMLNAKKDNETGNYIIDSYWIRNTDISDQTIITSAIVDFFVETETIISKLKEKYIQIRTEEKDTDGLFDYRLQNVKFNCIVGIAYNLESFEEFMDIIISMMWEITEDNLMHVKEVISTEILEEYNTAFSILKTKIVDIKNKKISRELVQKINEASTNMPNVLNKICHWFQRSAESKHNDFDLQFAFDLGLETIKNIHPEKNFIAKAIEKTVSDKIPGYFLKDYDGIFYNLFNNVYKNAYSKDGRNIEIRYILKNESGKKYIYLENDYDCTKDITLEQEKVKKAKELIHTGEYINRITGEGGTGIPKICKIISYDIGATANIDFDYILEENKFFIKIYLEEANGEHINSRRQ